MVAAENWCVKVDEKTYGPYSTQQMRKLAHEGRLAAWSLIAPAGSRAWKEAREENAFATFFGFDAKAATNSAKKTFGKAGGVPNPKLNGACEKTSVHDQAPGQSGSANFIIVFDVVSAAASRVEAAIHSLGNAFRLADNVWTVSCELTAVGVRNAIAPYLNRRESIFVVDATRGHSSWQNYSPEAQAKVTAAFVAPKSKQKVNHH